MIVQDKLERLKAAQLERQAVAAALLDMMAAPIAAEGEGGDADEAIPPLDVFAEADSDEEYPTDDEDEINYV